MKSNHIQDCTKKLNLAKNLTTTEWKLIFAQEWIIIWLGPEVKYTYKGHLWKFCDNSNAPTILFSKNFVLRYCALEPLTFRPFLKISAGNNYRISHYQRCYSFVKCVSNCSKPHKNASLEIFPKRKSGLLNFWDWLVRQLFQVGSTAVWRGTFSLISLFAFCV